MRELKAALQIYKKAVIDFEEGFAKKFGARHALAFPYGRSGLYTLFNVLGMDNAEVVMPAYTCVVVPNATVISGNIPKFVDISLKDYNMDLALLEDAITDKTQVVIPSHLFGYPMDINEIERIVSNAGQDIVVIQDCAHSFAAEYNGEFVCSHGDAALYSLNISKQMSSIFGGIITSNDDAIYEKMKVYRDQYFSRPSVFKQLRKFLYLVAVLVAFNYKVYGFVNSLERSRFLDRYTKYYEEDKIYLPKDFMELYGDVEARVGLVQLEKYDEIKKRRRSIAEYYNEQLQDLDGIELPPIIDGATYSHYVVRVKNRDELMEKMRRYGVQLGQLIEYSIPHMKAYMKYRDREFPNSLYCSKTTINLPNYPTLKDNDLIKIVDTFKEVINNG
jgi:dTDP-4-amino-4,6-dideoxygalactose transaminase